jgi:hypothetical protein
MHIATKTILFTGTLSIYAIIDFKRELERLKKLKAAQNNRHSSH